MTARATLAALQANVATARSAVALDPKDEKAKIKLRKAMEEQRLFIYRSKPAFTANGFIIRH